MANLADLDVLTLANVSVISNENIDAVYYPEKELLHFMWKQRTLGEPYQQTFRDALKFSETNKTTYFLSDIRNQGIVGPDDRKWFEEVALPRAMEVGLKKSAVVIDGNAFKLYYMNAIMRYSNNKGLPVKLFKSEHQAMEWLYNN